MSGIEITSPGADIVDGVPLDILGPADLSEGAEFSIRFTGGKPRSGKVIRLEDAGARAVIEVEGAGGGCIDATPRTWAAS